MRALLISASLVLTLLSLACGDAAPKATVPAGAPAYLMAVFTRPSGDAASAEELEYALQLPTGNAKAAALQASRPPRRSALAAASASPLDLNDDPMWQARLRYDARRNRETAGVVALRRMLRSSLSQVPSSPSCPAACDAAQLQMCWKGSCTSSPNLAFIDQTTVVGTRVVGVIPAGSTMINVLLDSADDTPANSAAALDAAQKFASTFGDEQSLLGQSSHTGAVDRDGDGRMTVVFTNQSGIDASLSSLVGFFSIADFLTAGDPGADGNEADLLWVRIPGTGNSTAVLAAGTMAHPVACKECPRCCVLHCA